MNQKTKWQEFRDPEFNQAELASVLRETVGTGRDPSLENRTPDHCEEH